MIKLSTLKTNPKTNQKTFICLSCGVEFKSRKACKTREPKYCSKKCYGARIITDEWLKKISEVKKGKTTWNKGVKMWENKEHPRGTKGMKGLNAGKKASPETIEKLRISHTGKKYPEITGEKHWNWKGGKTEKNEAIRKGADYKNWRIAVFKRDLHTCQICNTKGGYLHADHIKPFAYYPELRFEIDNGRTLCKSCHEQTDTYGTKAKKYATAIN